MSGLGSITNPLDFASALKSIRIEPGHVVYLRGGTYSGDYVCALNGTAENPITIRPYPNEHVVIDGSLLIEGSYTVWKDFEFLYSGWETRLANTVGSQPPNIPFDKTITILGRGTVLDGLVIHDMAGGPKWWLPAIGSTIRRCVIYNVGWSGPANDRGHGHSFYTQNDTGIKTVEDCIWFQSFSTGLKIYTEGSIAQGYRAQRNIAFNAAILFTFTDDYQMNEWVQDPNEGTGYTFIDEHTYHSNPAFDPIRIGLYNAVHGVTLRNNYWPEGLEINAGCTVLEDSGGFYGPRPASGTNVWVNPVTATRSHVAAYNWGSLDSLTFDLTAVTGLAAGDSVTVTNVQDYFVDRVTATLDANKCISVDMRAASHTVAAPTLWTAPVTTFPVFGCFVVEKV